MKTPSFDPSTLNSALGIASWARQAEFMDDEWATLEYLAECVRLRQALERNPYASVDALYRSMELP